MIGDERVKMEESLGHLAQEVLQRLLEISFIRDVLNLMIWER